MKETLIKCILQEEKTVDIGVSSMQGDVPMKNSGIQTTGGVLVPTGDDPVYIIDEPDFEAITPISLLDLEALFVKTDPSDPMSPVIEGYGYSVENHDENGVPILWTRTADEVADLFEGDSRIVIQQKLEGWPVEEPVVDPGLIDPGLIDIGPADLGGGKVIR